MPTAISWTDDTWNPVTGCTRVSRGCAHCYIERQTPMRIAGRRFARVGNSSTTGVQLHPERLERIPKGPKIFVCSMADLFHEEVPFEFISNVVDAMAAHEDRVFQVLTKRPQRIFDWFKSERAYEGWYAFPENVWVGVSVENARYTWRADLLRAVPAYTRFISAEPLVGSLFADVTPSVVRTFEWDCNGESDRYSVDVHERGGPLNLDGIQWLIAGGESGPGYQQLELEHARELRDACLHHDVAFFFKQVGGHTPKSGGKLLDGREWCEFPRQAVHHA